jgi:hypothetical protein
MVSVTRSFRQAINPADVSKINLYVKKALSGCQEVSLSQDQFTCQEEGKRAQKVSHQSDSDRAPAA